MANKFYAVKKGKKPGIYNTWPDCQKQVNGFPGAEYKSFKTKNEALIYMGEKTTSTSRTTASSNAIQLFSDGGSRNHGNKLGQHVKKDDKAAWAYLIINHGQKDFDSAGELGATNNKMEVLGLVNGLKKLIQTGCQDQAIDVILDSKYVLDAVTKGCLTSWKRRGWKKSDGTVIKNLAEFKELDQLLPQFSRLSFSWTKGHATNDGNNFVDQLLNQTMDKMEGKTPVSPVKENPVTITYTEPDYQPKKKVQPVERKEKPQPVAETKSDNSTKETVSEYIDPDKSVSDIEKSLRDLGFFDK
ncbi:ribonuclease H family protein [Apilactobacillus apinorum]|uniref:ribonuclease H family protein n=1 Tax=Apilactobacillus apinorum TaxID=1218495 RepID=UPI0030E89B65